MSHIKIPIYLYIYFFLCADGHKNHLKYTHTQIRLLHFKDLQHFKSIDTQEHIISLSGYPKLHACVPAEAQ